MMHKYTPSSCTLYTSSRGNHEARNATKSFVRGPHRAGAQDITSSLIPKKLRVTDTVTLMNIGAYGAVLAAFGYPDSVPVARIAWWRRAAPRNTFKRS